MKEKNKFSKKFITGKILGVSAAAAAAAVIVSAAAVRFSPPSLSEITSANAAQATEEAGIYQTAVIEEESESAEIDISESETEQAGGERETPQSSEKTSGTSAETAAYEETAEESAAAVSSNFILPVETDVLKRFSASVPVFSKTMEDFRIHTGVDFKLVGGEAIKAVGNGTVSRVLSDPMLGYVIEVDCGKFTARYCGIKQGTSVGIGDSVKSGDIIGEAGEIPSESADGSHLHFEIVKDGKTIDPMLVLEN